MKINHPNKLIYVFDFDGVVCDSTNECLITAYNAWQRYHRRPQRKLKVTDFSEVEFHYLTRLRPRVKGANGYFILLKTLYEQKLLSSQEEMDKLLFEYKDESEVFRKFFWKNNLNMMMV